MKTNNTISDIVRGIGSIDDLTTKELIGISRNLFEKGSFCNCEPDELREITIHKCKEFHPYDFEHSTTCECCQKQMLLYYLGRLNG